MPLRVGDPSRIGHYRLTARLGAGGMGVVYLGTSKDGRQVAIKTLRPELADDQEFRARFRREVAVLARVQGLCTVRVIEADTESAKPFLATEYAEGPSLSEHVAAAGPLPAQMLYGLATGLAEALAAIHAAGVVHRDLKPGNVILTRAGPKVIDFGIAQTVDATAVTRTGIAVGSPGFMAPEQITGQAGPPADIFSWALTVAYAASGQPPFGTGPADAIMYRILHESPDIAAVPLGLRSTVEAALAMTPADRPAAPDLLGWLTSRAGQPVTADDVPTQYVLSRTWLLPASEHAAVAGRHRRFWPLPILAGTLAVVIGTVAALVANSSGTPHSNPSGTGLSPGRSPLRGPPSSSPRTGGAPPSTPAVTRTTGALPAVTSLSGKCVIGSIPGAQGAVFVPGAPQNQTIDGKYYPATLGYQLTLTNTSTVTADLTGFAVVFYDRAGTELGFDREGVHETFLTVGRSQTWTEYSSTDTSGHASFGHASIPNGSAACQLVETTPSASSRLTTTACKQGPLTTALVAANPQLNTFSWHVVSFACQGSWAAIKVYAPSTGYGEAFLSRAASGWIGGPLNGGDFRCSNLQAAFGSLVPPEAVAISLLKKVSLCLTS